jgi:hypothetical protein
LEIDFSEFEDENEEFATRTWPQLGNLQALTWRQTQFYPENCIAKITVIEDRRPFKVVKK